MLCMSQSRTKPQAITTDGAVGVAPGLGGGTVPYELAVSAQVGAAANNQTLPAVAGRRTYIAGFTVDGLGATGASIINVTITGVLGGTITYTLSIPAGVGAQLAAPLRIEFSRPIPASADGTAIVVNVPSFGAGNTQANASAHGFQL